VRYHELLAGGAAAVLVGLVVWTIRHDHGRFPTWEWLADDGAPDDGGSDDGGNDRRGALTPLPLPGGGTPDPVLTGSG
jgi:hypothetical protein